MGNLAFQEDFRDEMLDGNIVLMSPRPTFNHNIVAGNIFRVFANFLQKKSCIAIADGMDVYLTEKDRVIPDAMIVCNRDIIRKNGIHGVPDLIVEVLSPGTANHDKGYKKDLYEKCGVKEYWVVEPDAKSVEVYLLKDSRYQLDNVYYLYPDYLLEKMNEDEKDAVILKFKVSLYEDLTISLKDIFGNTL